MKGHRIYFFLLNMCVVSADVNPLSERTGCSNSEADGANQVFFFNTVCTRRRKTFKKSSCSYQNIFSSFKVLKIQNWHIRSNMDKDKARANIRLSKCHKIQTSMISDKKPQPKEMHETTNNQTGQAPLITDPPLTISTTLSDFFFIIFFFFYMLQVTCDR